jgi:hypothetical protein
MVAILVWLRQRRPHDTAGDLFAALGTDAKSAKARVAAPPVDLSKPIAGDAAWQAIYAHAQDAAYRRAVETLRLRYQVVGNPMLLSNTLKATMQRAGLTFREAVLRVAEDDGLHGHR